MEKIIAATFDIADQKCKLYNPLEWHNFIADTREQAEDPTASLEDLFDEVYGDEFWFEVAPKAFVVYDVAFDLRSEEFILCRNDDDIEFIRATAEECGDEDEIFWAE